MGVPQVVYNTLADFGLHTTIGGLCNAGFTSSKPRQIYWLVIFFALFGYTIKLLVDNISQYLQYSVLTSTDLTYSTQLTFPAITICNQNRSLQLKFSAVQIKPHSYLVSLSCYNN